MKKRIKSLVVFNIILVMVTIAWSQTTVEDFLITWDAPTENADGTLLTDLAGYQLCMKIGSSIPVQLQIADMPTECTASAQIGAVDIQTLQAITLTLGVEDKLYVRIAAFDTSGNVSAWSDEASTAFDKKSPAKIINLKVIRKS